MLRRILTVLFLFVGCTSVAFANPWNEKPPVQVYEQAGSNQANSTPQAEQAVLTAKPHQAAANDDNAPQLATKPAETDKKDKSSLTLLQNQINQLNQNHILFAQSENNKFSQLDGKVSGLQQQLKQLDQALLLLNQEVIQLSKKLNQPVGSASQAQIGAVKAESSSTPWWREVFQRVGPIGLASILVVIILLVIIVLLARRSPKKTNPQAAPTVESPDDTGDEYDYMGSEESIPAKLNLARAYIAMEDFASAKKMIAEILARGTPEQCQEADSLMKEMSQKS